MTSDTLLSATELNQTHADPFSGTAPHDRVFARAIVVPVKVAADAQKILGVVEACALSLNRPVEFVSVVDETWDVAQAAADLADVAEDLAQRILDPVRCRLVVSDDPAAVVMDLGADRVVVMPTSATPFRGDHFVGSYAAGLLARSTEPVILVGPEVDEARFGTFTDMVVPLGSDSDCLGVLPVAYAWASQLGLPVRLVHVREENEDQLLVDSDGHARLWFPDELHTSLSVEARDATDTPDVLVELSQTSLVMMATHARCGLARVAEGSILFDTVARSTAPVVATGPRISEVGTPANVPDPTRSPLRCTGRADSIAEDIRSYLSNGGWAEEIVTTPTSGAVKRSGGFVVVLDGSDRAAEAIPTAAALAGQSGGRSLSAVVVAPEAETRNVLDAVRAQLGRHGAGDTSVSHVLPRGRDAEMGAMAWVGHVPVVSAFGTWKTGATLWGLLGSMVRENAPAVVGVGPHVVERTIGESAGPVIVCVDESRAVDAIVDRLDWFVEPTTREVIVLHIDEPEPNPRRRRVLEFEDLSGWPEVAALIEKRWDVKAQARTIVGSSIPESIAAFAASVDAAFVVMASHHRPIPGRPTIASASLSTVAYAECPVGILSATS